MTIWALVLLTFIDDTYVTTTNNESNKYNVTSGEISYGDDIVDTISDTTLITETLSVDDIKVEHVVLKVDLDHTNLAQLTIEITSPGPDGIALTLDGSTSTLMSKPNSVDSSLVFEFSSVQFYGENGGGEWTVTIIDDTSGDNGTLNSLELTIYGSNIDDNDQYIFTDEFVSPVSTAYDNVGTDWINASTVTSDVDVDLTALTMSYATVIPDISGLTKVANIVAGDGNDTLTGNNAVNNILDGGRGSDTVVYADLLDLDVNYSVTFNEDHVLVETLLDGTLTGVGDTLYSIENLSFDDVLHPILTIGFLEATIQTDANNYIDNVTLNYFKDGVDTDVSTLVEGGGISFVQNLDFDAVKLSDPAAYTDGIAADDAVAILQDIVYLNELVIGSAAWHAGDVNNDGAIAADDAVAVLQHIVLLDNIDTFDLIDNTMGNRITNLDVNAIDVGQWSVVANGDVNQSGGFVDAYVVQVDII